MIDHPKIEARVVAETLEHSTTLGHIEEEEELEVEGEDEDVEEVLSKHHHHYCHYFLVSRLLLPADNQLKCTDVTSSYVVFK